LTALRQKNQVKHPSRKFISNTAREVSIQYLSVYLNFVLSPLYEHNDKIIRAHLANQGARPQFKNPWPKLKNTSCFFSILDLLKKKSLTEK